MTTTDAIFELQIIKANLVGEYASEVSDKRAEYIKRKIDAVEMAIALLGEKWMGGVE